MYPALILAYLGQGARLIEDGQAVLPNIFYRTIPGPQNGALFWCAHRPLLPVRAIDGLLVGLSSSLLSLPR